MYGVPQGMRAWNFDNLAFWIWKVLSGLQPSRLRVGPDCAHSIGGMDCDLSNHDSDRAAVAS